jgi:hypothetical protein
VAPRGCPLDISPPPVFTGSSPFNAVYPESIISQACPLGNIPISSSSTISRIDDISCNSTTSISSGFSAAFLNALTDALRIDGISINELRIERYEVSDELSAESTFIGFLVKLSARSSLTINSAAAPSLIGQNSKSLSGSAITLDSMTLSIGISFWKWARGLSEPLW